MAKKRPGKRLLARWKRREQREARKQMEAFRLSRGIF